MPGTARQRLCCGFARRFRVRRLDPSPGPDLAEVRSRPRRSGLRIRFGAQRQGMSELELQQRQLAAVVDDNDRNLWLAWVHFQTGAFVPRDGRAS